MLCDHLGPKIGTLTSGGKEYHQHECTSGTYARCYPGGHPASHSCVGCPLHTYPHSAKPRTLETLWDRVTVINLARRWDRETSILEQFKMNGFPWMPELHMQTAIDGRRVPMPNGFTAGPGAWGCFESHRQALRDAINAGCESILILEDDAMLRPDFADRARSFFAEIPQDWEVAFLGGRHAGPPGIVSAGVHRVRKIFGLYGYALRGEGLTELYRYWSGWHETHCDIVAATWFGTRKAYIPAESMIGHSGGWSDISRKDKPTEWYDPPLPSEVATRHLGSRRMGQKPRQEPNAEFAECANLGSLIRTETCAPCKGARVDVRSCEAYGECAPRRYKQTKQPHVCRSDCPRFSPLVQLGQPTQSAAAQTVQIAGG